MQSILRVSVLTFAASGLAYLVAATQIAQSFRVNNPQLALAWAPWDSRARANLAWLNVESGEPAARRAARVQAEAALNHDGGDATAQRVMGYLSDDRTTAAGWFDAADETTRRDFPAQMWLLQAAVDRNDVPEVLRRYDIGLRTSALAPGILLPILAKAVDDPEIAIELRKRLRDWPNWTVWFFREAIKTSTSDRNLALLGSVAGVAPAPDQMEVVGALVQRLIADRQYALAWHVYQSNTLQAKSSGPVQDPSFRRVPLFPPFDWSLATESPVDASITGSGSDRLLTVVNVEGQGGEAASQIARLGTGRYKLAIEMAEGDNGASVGLKCLDNESKAQIVLEILPAQGRLTQVDIPPDWCRFARITLALKPREAGSQLAIRRLDITPAS